jgi:hypothetical protein
MALGPAIVLSKLYANSMMVFVNDRIPSGHSRDSRSMSAVVLDSLHFAPVAGESEDTALEQPAWEGGYDDERSRMSGQMVEVFSDQRSLHEEGR